LAAALQGEIGEVSAGAAADLILVDGNPLEDITLLTQHDRIRMVVKDGLVAKVRQ
jgi:imidazolonepropionase-like amidohydrolase